MNQTPAEVTEGAWAEQPGIAPWRQSLDRALVGSGEALWTGAQRRWLFLANLGVGLVLVGAVLAPYLRSVGLEGPAQAIYTAYLLLCEQRPSHSYFWFGQQVALEQRVFAMFAAQLAGGLLYGTLRRSMRPLSWRIFALLALPIAVDGFSQTFGLRDSDAFWRTLTGAVFNLGLVWFAYPRIERAVSTSSTQPAQDQNS